MCFPLSRTMADKYVFHFSMSNRLSDRYPGRAQKHTPLARLSSTPTPFAGRLMGRMQYAPILLEKDEVSSGRCYLLSRTIADKYVFHFSMSNRLLDKFLGRAQKHTPLVRLSSTLSPFAGRLVGRMQYAPTFPEKDEVSSGRYYLLSRTIRDEYVFNSIMSNRLSDRYPCRGVLNTPHIDSTSTHSPFAGRLVGRMQYAPTLSEKDKVSSGRYFLLSRTKVDKYVFHFFMYNRLLDRYPGRGVLHTLPAHLSSTISPFAGRLIGRMQYAPTLPAEKSDLKGWRGVMFGAKGEESVFHSIMFNRLSDRYPGRAQKHTPLARLSSTPTPFAGRLVGRMQYAPTLPEKDKVSLGWCFPSSQTIGDKSVFHFSMSNRLSDRYPGRAQKHTPLARLSSTLSPLAGRIGGVCNTLLPCRQKNRISRVDGRLCLGQREINMYFISSCLIGYQIDTHVGAYCIRPLRVYRLPPRPLQGVW